MVFVAGHKAKQEVNVMLQFHKGTDRVHKL